MMVSIATGRYEQDSLPWIPCVADGIVETAAVGHYLASLEQDGKYQDSPHSCSREVSKV